MPNRPAPISDLARMYRERIPTAPKSIGRLGPVSIGGGGAPNWLRATGNFLKTAVESLDPRFIASEGGRSVEHVYGDAKELAKSIVTGEDTLSQSPSARAYQAAGGGLEGVLAAALPYINVGTAIVPTTKVLTPAGRVALGADAAEKLAQNQILKQADQRIAELSSIRAASLADARLAVETQNPDMYQRALNQYLNQIKLGYTKPEDVFDGIAYGRTPIAARAGLGRATTDLAIGASTSAPRTAQIGINPQKAIEMIQSGSPYGAMFDPERTAQVASERGSYVAKFVTPQKINLMRSAGVDVDNLDSYQLDRLIVENEVMGIPYSAPASQRPIYAAVPQSTPNPGIAGYAGSPFAQRFNTVATYDVTGRPATVLPMDSFPSFASAKQPLPADLAPAIPQLHNYKEMQIGGGPLPLENLRDLTIAYEAPESIRYLDPDRFNAYMNRFYPDATASSFFSDRFNAEIRLDYLKQQLALLQAAQERGIPVSVLRSTGLDPELSSAIQQGRRASSEATNRLSTYRLPYSAAEITPQTSYSTVADPDAQIAGLQSAITDYENYLNWANKNRVAIEQRGDLINKLIGRSNKGRTMAELRARERAAVSLASSGATQEAVDKAVKVLPYPANSPTEASRFLKAAYDGDIEKAGDIYLDLFDRWGKELADGTYPESERYFMYSNIEGLVNLGNEGVLPNETLAGIIDYIRSKSAPVIDEPIYDLGVG